MIKVTAKELTLALWVVPTVGFPNEVTTLYCRPDDGNTWVGKLSVDYTQRTIDWSGTIYEMTYLDDLYIVSVSKGGIGATTLLIERDTGSFWRSGVGRFCVDGDCTKEVKSGAFQDAGTCRSQTF